MSAARRRVAITGLGVVSAVGQDAAEFFANLAAGKSGVSLLATSPNTVAASVKFDADAHFTKMQLTTLDRFAQFGVVAAEQAVRDAGLEDAQLQAARVAVYFGSGIGWDTLDPQLAEYLRAHPEIGPPPARG